MFHASSQNIMVSADSVSIGEKKSSVQHHHYSQLTIAFLTSPVSERQEEKINKYTIFALKI
jgi:hypothetical protein